MVTKNATPAVTVQSSSQPSPATAFPSSHSSPSTDCKTPSPQNLGRPSVCRQSNPQTLHARCPYGQSPLGSMPSSHSSCGWAMPSPQKAVSPDWFVHSASQTVHDARPYAHPLPSRHFRHRIPLDRLKHHHHIEMLNRQCSCTPHFHNPEGQRTLIHEYSPNRCHRSPICLTAILDSIVTGRWEAKTTGANPRNTVTKGDA